MQGGPFARGALYYLLRNRLYLGEIVHKGVVHAGRHPPIVGLEIFSAVQESLDAKIGARAERLTHASKSPLAGVLYDSAGNRMSPTSSRGKSGSLHRYYVSSPKLSGRLKAAGAVSRVPAGLLEDLVKDRLSRLFFADADWDWAKARQQIIRIAVSAEHIDVELSATTPEESEAGLSRRLPKVDRLSRDGTLLRLIVSARLKAGKGRTLLLDANGRLAVGQKPPDQTLVRAIARAHAWRSRLASGAAVNIAAIAKEEGFTNGPVRHLLPLAYLSPDVTRAALAGRLRPDLNLEQLVQSDLPLSWRAQRRLFGLDSAPEKEG
jgi:hypothetical protein